MAENTPVESNPAQSLNEFVDFLDGFEEDERLHNELDTLLDDVSFMEINL